MAVVFFTATLALGVACVVGKDSDTHTHTQSSHLVPYLGGGLGHGLLGGCCLLCLGCLGLGSSHRLGGHGLGLHLGCNGCHWLSHWCLLFRLWVHGEVCFDVFHVHNPRQSVFPNQSFHTLAEAGFLAETGFLAGAGLAALGVTYKCAGGCGLVPQQHTCKLTHTFFAGVAFLTGLTAFLGVTCADVDQMHTLLCTCVHPLQTTMTPPVTTYLDHLFGCHLGSCLELIKCISVDEQKSISTATNDNTPWLWGSPFWPMRAWQRVWQPTCTLSWPWQFFSMPRAVRVRMQCARLHAMGIQHHTPYRETRRANRTRRS